MKCKSHKTRDATLVDETESAWCEECKPKMLLTNYGKRNNFPQVAHNGISIWGGAGAWKVTVPRLTSYQVNLLLEHLHISVDEPKPQESLSEPQEMASERQEVSTLVSAQQEPQKSLSEPQPCFLFLLGKCNKDATREDQHGRFWCTHHAPQGSYLAPWLSSFVEPEQFDAPLAPYKACTWIDAASKEHPASQALSYALARDYAYLDLQWYTPELKRLFAQAPQDAIKWTEALKAAKKAGNRNQAMQLAAQINAHIIPVAIPENLERCFCCSQGTELFDKHGRPYCLLHAPDDLKPSIVHDLPFLPIDSEVKKPEPQEVPSEAPIMDEVDVCSVDEAHGAALYFSPDTGEPLCEQCWQSILAKTG